MSELHLAVSVRMAGALRKAGEAAAKLRRLGAAVSERSEFCRSSRSAAVLAVKLFSVPLGLLVLFGLRKEHPPQGNRIKIREEKYRIHHADMMVANRSIQICIPEVIKIS